MTQFSSSDYMTAGLATMSRQCICEGLAYAPLTTGEPISTAALLILKAAAHRADLSIKILERAAGAMIVLTEQAAYPLLLQTSDEMDKLMATQIPLEERQLSIFKMIRPFFTFASPLAWISLGNYIDSFQAQIDCHQAILDHFNNLWEWKTTTVTGVIDGDTIYVDAYDISVRIEGIDCPETWHEEWSEGNPEDPKWDPGYAAKAYTESRLLGKEVELRARKELDDYGRIIAKVYLDGKNFANELVLEGHAKFIFWHFP